MSEVATRGLNVVKGFALRVIGRGEKELAPERAEALAKQAKAKSSEFMQQVAQVSADKIDLENKISREDTKVTELTKRIQLVQQAIVAKQGKLAAIPTEGRTPQQSAQAEALQKSIDKLTEQRDGFAIEAGQSKQFKASFQTELSQMATKEADLREQARYFDNQADEYQHQADLIRTKHGLAKATEGVNDVFTDIKSSGVGEGIQKIDDEVEHRQNAADAVSDMTGLTGEIEVAKLENKQAADDFLKEALGDDYNIAN